MPEKKRIILISLFLMSAFVLGTGLLMVGSAMFTGLFRNDNILGSILIYALVIAPFVYWFSSTDDKD